MNDVDKLSKICTSIAGQGDITDLIREVVEGIRELFDVHRVTFWVLNRVSGVLESLVGTGLEGKLTLPVGRGLAGISAEKGEDIIVVDAHTDPRFDRSVDDATGYRTMSVACLPVIRNGELVAIVQAINRLRTKEEGGREVVMRPPKETITIGSFSQEDIRQLRMVANLAGVALENAQRLALERWRFRQLGLSHSRAIDLRDHITGEHTLLVATVVKLLAKEMRLSRKEVHALELAAELHDVGKTGIPDNVLNKQGRFDEYEWEIMRRHAVFGYEMLIELDWPSDFALIPDLVRHHHERGDGSGYPDGLKMEDLSLSARILSVADVFCAMSQKRPYKDAKSSEDALRHCRELTQKPNEWFDPTVVNALERILATHGFSALEAAARVQGTRSNTLFD